MLTLDPRFDYLRRPDMPRMIREGMRTHGTTEVYGAGNNAAIIQWGKELGIGSWYKKDSIPWCGVWMAKTAKDADKDYPSAFYRAQSWLQFGERAYDPSIGDVLVFERGVKGSGKGHVGLYVGETNDYFYVLGGNQRDTVKVSRISKDRFMQARRQYKIGRPKTAVRHILGYDFGRVSMNEA